MQIVDFTNLPKRNKMYAGANGSKISVIYGGQQYMLKFPPPPTKNKDMSYSNSCFSEYLGCQIYESIGIPVQKTMLGTYTVKGKEKIVVACGDFTEPGVTLQDFASLKNQIIDSERSGYGTELSDILHTFEEQNAVDRMAVSSPTKIITFAFGGSFANSDRFGCPKKTKCVLSLFARRSSRFNLFCNTLFCIQAVLQSFHARENISAVRIA